MAWGSLSLQLQMWFFLPLDYLSYQSVPSTGIGVGAAVVSNASKKYFTQLSLSPHYFSIWDPLSVNDNLGWGHHAFFTALSLAKVLMRCGRPSHLCLSLLHLSEHSTLLQSTQRMGRGRVRMSHLPDLIPISTSVFTGSCYLLAQSVHISELVSGCVRLHYLYLALPNSEPKK